MIANVTETIGTDFVSSFVDHRPSSQGGDILWLSALNHDRCKSSAVNLDAARDDGGSGISCGTGVKAISSTDLVHFNASMALPDVGTCNTEVAKVTDSPPGLPPHRYVMILESFMFKVNNNADGDLSHGWVDASGSKPPHAPSGGPSIRHEGGYYYVITGGTTVMLCRSKDLGAYHAEAVHLHRQESKLLDRISEMMSVLSTNLDAYCACDRSQ